MQTRFYSERSNARRAARAAGVDPDLVTESDDGFTFSPPPEPNDAESAAVEFGRDVSTKDARTKDEDDDIPAFLKISQEARNAAWERYPPKAATKPEIAATSAEPKSKKVSSKHDKSASKAAGTNKTATLLSMLKGNGATVEELTKATGWLPHTLRARLSGFAKPKSKGGEGLKIERARKDGVTSYRIASASSH